MNRWITAIIIFSMAFALFVPNMALATGSDTTVSDKAEVFLVTVKASDEAHGNVTVTGSGNFYAGDFAQVRAVAAEGYRFVGWYDGEALVSEDEVYRFRVTENVELIGVFEDAAPNTNPDSNDKLINDDSDSDTDSSDAASSGSAVTNNNDSAEDDKSKDNDRDDNDDKFGFTDKSSTEQVVITLTILIVAMALITFVVLLIRGSKDD